VWEAVSDDNLLREAIVDMVGLLCYAMQKDGKLCQEPLWVVARGLNHDWVGYCYGHFRSWVTRVDAGPYIEISDIVHERLLERIYQHG